MTSETTGASGRRGGRDLRSELLRTSRELLDEAGPSALSMREVARRAGCTHQAPYHYFANREAILAVSDSLQATDFYLEKHGLIYEAMLACLARREPPDLATVTSELRRQERLDLVGGAALLAELAPRGRPVRLLGVRLEQLSDASVTPVQVTLDEPEHGWRDAERAVDRASARFGAGSVRPASLLEGGSRSSERPARDLD